EDEVAAGRALTHEQCIAQAVAYACHLHARRTGAGILYRDEQAVHAGLVSGRGIDLVVLRRQSPRRRIARVGVAAAVTDAAHPEVGREGKSERQAAVRELGSHEGAPVGRAAEERLLGPQAVEALVVPRVVALGQGDVRIVFLGTHLPPDRLLLDT